MKQKYFTICFHDLFLKYYPKMTIKSQSKDYTIFAEINSRIWGDNDSNLAAYLKTAFQDSSLQWLEYFFPALIQRVFQCRTTKLLSQKRRHLAIFCISFLWQRGTCPEKRKDYFLNKSHLTLFCIDRTTIGCYDFVWIHGSTVNLSTSTFLQKLEASAEQI